MSDERDVQNLFAAADGWNRLVEISERWGWWRLAEFCRRRRLSLVHRGCVACDRARGY